MCDPLKKEDLCTVSIKLLVKAGQSESLLVCIGC